MKLLAIEEYAESVARLMSLALHDTSGSRVAAQVLLSAYNGDAFQLNVSDLGQLDSHYYYHAIIVIRGRTECNWEPHHLLNNGDKLFEKIWYRWQGLHIDERHKVECRICNGRGKIYRDEDDEDGTMCPKCKGTGRVCLQTS